MGHTYSKDVFGKNAEILRMKKLFLFDMDGTIYEEEMVFEGTHEILKLIKELGGSYVFITNNSSKAVKDYVSKVNRLGIESNEENFFTSAQATILYLKKHYPGKKVYCQGTKSLINELMDSGIKVAELPEDDVEVVLVGFDTEMTSQKIENTCEVLQKDLPFLATNPDLRCPVNFGFIPDCGSICQILEFATGKKPVYIGKPEPTMVDIVVEKVGCSKEETVVIGDRLYTDIATGLNAGVTSVCVLTGEATIEDIVNGDIKPTFTFPSVKEIKEVIKVGRKS